MASSCANSLAIRSNRMFGFLKKKRRPTPEQQMTQIIDATKSQMEKIVSDWRPTVVLSTPPPWEPNRPQKNGYNWIPVGDIPEPIWITLFYSKGGRDGRVLVKSAHANREGVIYLDCEENGALRRVRADYIRKFVNDDGTAIEPREFLSKHVSILLWGRSIRAKAPPHGWGRGGIGK